MKRLILLLAVPVTLVAAHAMGGSATEAVVTPEAANLCEICCPEDVCPEDCCPLDCCPLEAVMTGCEDGCPGEALLNAAADKLTSLTSHVGSVVASIGQDR